MLTTDPVVGLCKLDNGNGNHLKIKIVIGLGVVNIAQDKCCATVLIQTETKNGGGLPIKQILCYGC